MSGYLFLEGSDSLVGTPVDSENVVQMRASQHIGDMLARRDQLEFTAAWRR